MSKVDFGSFDICTEILEDLRHHGFENPMPIQEQAIPELLLGRDMIAQAKTGTGKTLAFAIPIINGVDAKVKKPQALIIVPTRELAHQVAEEFRKLGYKKRMMVATVYGGVSIQQQADKIRKGANIIVGTPGRLLDLLNRGILSLDEIQHLVLDEADRMLDMGFIQDIKKIISKTPSERQTMLFSATIPDEIVELASDITRNPIRASTGEDELLVEEIDHCYYEVTRKNKLDSFFKILAMEKPEAAIVFCNTKRWAETMVNLMRKRRYNAESLHGNMTQKQRDNVMQAFRNKKFRYLIATDVAARGLDIEGITHVINYDIPMDPSNYVHRIGRTGRAGAAGKAITLIDSSEVRSLWDIENRCETSIPQATF
jgi:ATP-dependent RNA helicase DeaD